jgi:transcriptional regulator with XRE-family HTH domain
MARETYIEIENEFNVEMQRVRLEKNISYLQIAEAIGSSKSTVGDIERGIRIPSMKIGISICKALDMNVESFVAFLYEEAVKKLQTDLERQCLLYEVEIPGFMKDQFSYIDRMVVKAYQAGIEEGKKIVAKEVRNKIAEMTFESYWKG